MTKKDVHQKVKRTTAFQRAMIQISKETMGHTIELPNEKERFYEILINELSKDIIKIMEESKKIYYKGIILGVAFGVLGNFLVTSVFRFADDYSNFWNQIYLLVSGASLLYCGWLVYRKLRYLQEGRTI